MKVIKPFFLGALAGLGLALVLLIALFFSPLREKLYFAADPEMADIRYKLGRYQEWLAQTDLRLAERGTEAGRASDSLQSAQAKAWRDYKGWRNRLGELARAYAHPSAEGFWPWAYSLRWWLLPIGLSLMVLPGLFSAVRARRRYRPGKLRAAAAPKSARAQALSDFEDAIKKVARISNPDSERGNERGQDRGKDAESQERQAPVAAKPRARETRAKPASIEPPTEALSASVFDDSLPAAANPMAYPSAEPLTHPSVSRQAEPDTVPLDLPSHEDTRDPGRDTQFLERGPRWGEPASLPGERIGMPGPMPAPSGLSMEDEDGEFRRAEAKRAAADPNGDESGEETLGLMPPTTEVERVERRKDEVLKLARKGMTSSEISRRMRISQDQVEIIIRLRREKG